MCIHTRIRIEPLWKLPMLTKGGVSIPDNHGDSAYHPEVTPSLQDNLWID